MKLDNFWQKILTHISTMIMQSQTTSFCMKMSLHTPWRHIGEWRYSYTDL